MVTIERADLRVGSIIVAVASVYSSMGDVSVKAFTTLARHRISSALAATACGVSALANILAPMDTKKEKNIHTAKAASADVAVLRKMIENKMATPNQKEI
jgi:hypothetical protein